MTDHRKPHAPDSASARRWIALDSDGRAHGRFCASWRVSPAIVRQLMQSFLPEILDLRILRWDHASFPQMVEAMDTPLFTPDSAEKLGLTPILWPDLLQCRFPRVGGVQ